MPRYVRIPPHQILEGITTENRETKEQEPVEYSFENLHREFVWTSDEWLKSSDTVTAFERCREALCGKDPGAWCALESEDFDVYKPIAMKAGTQIQQGNPYRVPVLTARVALLAPVLSAPTKLTEEAATSATAVPASTVKD